MNFAVIVDILLSSLYSIDLYLQIVGNLKSNYDKQEMIIEWNITKTEEMSLTYYHE